MSRNDTARRPNILWISTHDINPHLGAYRGVWPGADEAVTPRLDSLAAEGLCFDQAFAAAPVCAPSRSAIMTGCYPISIGTMHMRSNAVPPADVRLFSEYLRAAGYYATNNWFTDFQMDVPPTAFDDCSETAHWRNRPSSDTPFFSAFHSLITHESAIYLDDDAFAAATSHVPEDVRHDPDSITLPPYYPDTPVFRRCWARYLDLISEMDHWVGGILDELDDDGLTEETIVVFWSDHGLGMPRAKRWAHEAGLREPLIIRWPNKLPEGEHRAELAQLLDLAPTMLAAGGIDIPAHMQGSPLFNADGELAAPNRYAFGARDRMDEQRDAARTVRDDRFRYILNLHPDRPEMLHHEYADRTDTWREMRRLHFDEARQLARGATPDLLNELQRTMVSAAKPTEELYDIVNDPHETRNLVTEPAFGSVLDELRTALQDWRDRVGDLGTMPEEELIESWRPGGHRQLTARPHVSHDHDHIVASCATAGSSLAWTRDEPGPIPEIAPWQLELGLAPGDGRRWQLYTTPIEAEDAPVWVRAWRIGFEPSEIVRIDTQEGPA